MRSGGNERRSRADCRWELSRRGRSQQTCRDTTREFLPFFSRNPAVSRGNPTPADDVTARGVLFVERNRLRVRSSGSCRWCRSCRSSGSGRSGRSPPDPIDLHDALDLPDLLDPLDLPQHDTHLWLFFTPIPSSSLIVSGNGEMRWTGPLAMSTVVCPARLMIFGSAPLETRYSIISLSPRAAALCNAVLPSWSLALTSTCSSSTRYFTAASMPPGAKRWWFAAKPSP